MDRCLDILKTIGILALQEALLKNAIDLHLIDTDNATRLKQEIRSRFARLVDAYPSSDQFLTAMNASSDELDTVLYSIGFTYSLYLLPITSDWSLRYREPVLGSILTLLKSFSSDELLKLTEVEGLQQIFKDSIIAL